MKRFKVFKNGVCTNQWTSDFAGSDHHEDCFGKPGTYELVEEDMTEELAERDRNRREEAANESVRKVAKRQIKDFDLEKIQDPEARELLRLFRIFVLKFQ